MELARHRPFAITTLAAIVLCFTGMNAVRFGAALAFWDILFQYAPRPGPAYVAATGLLWVLAGLPLCWGIWKGRAWARRAAAAAVVLYAIYYWIDREILQNGPPRANWPFALGATLLVTLFASLTLLGATSYFSQRRT